MSSLIGNHNIIEKYRSDFEALVDALTCKYTNHPYGQALINEINKLDKYNNYQIEYEDIRQELATLWIKYEQDWKENRPKSRIRTYLLRRSVWGIRDWLKVQYRILDQDITRDESMSPQLLTQWLANGCPDGPYSLLTSYERYILYLYMIEDKTLTDIGNIVHKSRHTVRKVLNQIKELINEKAYSG